MFICVFIYMCADTYLCVPVGRLTSNIDVIFVLFRCGSPLGWIFPCRWGWPAQEPPKPNSASTGWGSMSVPPWMEIYASTKADGFFVYEFWELNTSSHICKTSILPIELSLQSLKYELNYLNCSIEAPDSPSHSPLSCRISIFQNSGWSHQSILVELQLTLWFLDLTGIWE